MMISEGHIPTAYLFHTQLGYSIPVGPGGVRIGRSAENQVVIPDATVSRQHAHFLFFEGRYWIKDLGSAAGVYLNDRRITGQAEAFPGEWIKISSAEFELRTDQVSRAAGVHPAALPKSKQPQLLLLGAFAAAILILVIAIGAGGSSTGKPASAVNPAQFIVPDPSEQTHNTQLPTRMITTPPFKPEPTETTRLILPSATFQPKIPTSQISSRLNPREMRSVAQNFLSMIENKDISFLDGIGINRGLHKTFNPIEGGQLVKPDTFFQELQERMDDSNQVKCRAFHQDEGTLIIWTQGWTSKWMITEFCHGECKRIDPPVISDQAGFVFIPSGSNYHLWVILVGKYDPNDWNQFEFQTILPCDPEALKPPRTSLNLIPEMTVVQMMGWAA
jgi:pSer/pThr/pTyr-binding forkhead associated (FHA) protein